jgi:hypothetical protein
LLLVSGSQRRRPTRTTIGRNVFSPSCVSQPTAMASQTDLLEVGASCFSLDMQSLAAQNSESIGFALGVRGGCGATHAFIASAG